MAKAAELEKRVAALEARAKRPSALVVIAIASLAFRIWSVLDDE